jgi:hypothetical protein
MHTFHHTQHIHTKRQDITGTKAFMVLFLINHTHTCTFLTHACTPGDESAETKSLKLLLSFLVKLMSNEAMRKDALTSSSIIMCALVQRSHAHPEAVAAQLACISGCHETLDLQSLAAKYFSPSHGSSGKRAMVTAEGAEAWMEGCCAVNHGRMPPFAQQALFRGVCSVGLKSALTYPLPLRNGETASLMFSIVYDMVCKQCAATSDLFLVCYALQTISHCIETMCEQLRAWLDNGANSTTDGHDNEADFIQYARAHTNVQTIVKVFEAGVKIMWPYCEDPFQGIAEQTKDIFAKLIHLRELAETLARSLTACGDGKGDAQTGGLSKQELRDMFADLLDMAVASKPTRKARYRVMSALVLRIGTKALLSTSSDFMRVMFESMRDQSVGTCVGQLLTEMLANAEECEGDEWWMTPCLHALTTADARLKHAICNYVLPTLARSMPGSINLLLQALEDAQPKEAEIVSNLWAITAVIKISRRWGADTGSQQTVSTKSSARFLRAALLHVSDDMRLNALEMICINPKNSEPVSEDELALVREFLTMNMKSSSSFYRQRSMELLKKLFMRLRVSKYNLETRADKAKNAKRAPTQAQIDVIEQSQSYSTSVESFLSWLCVSLTAALYPGGSFERNIMALELYATVIDVWMPSVAPHPDANLIGVSPSEQENETIAALLFRAEAVHTLINSIVNSFDHVRRSAFDLICRFPAPLRGIDTEDAVRSLLRWANTLVSSPRARESDAGTAACMYVC